MYYLRRIEMEHWEGKACLDAVSVSDLHTFDNDISVWQVNNLAELDMVGLAIAMTRTKLKDFYVVILNAEEISALGLQVKDQMGESRYNEVNEFHKNIYIPTIWEMGYLSKYVYKQLHNKNNVHYFAESELRQILYKTVKEQRMDVSFMKDKDGQYLRKSLLTACIENKDKVLNQQIQGLAQ